MVNLPTGINLTTKFFLPPNRPNQVHRRRLLSHLDGLLQPGVRLAVIAAPAGFGKTSLLAEWSAQLSNPPAWITIDEGDNDPYIFLSYLLTSIQRQRPGAAPKSLELLAAQPPAPVNAITVMLVNELSTLQPEHPLVLALDDWQFIHSDPVREILGFLVDRLPPGLRIAVATRTDPLLPLARLRARGQMIEVRAAELRFTTEEAREFLSCLVKLPFDENKQSALNAALVLRTEGWAAGLQMAGLALQGLVQKGRVETGSQYQPATEDEVNDFIQSFSGSHRFVLDYLVEEVLERLPQPTVDFLLQTSLLEHFCAELCAVVIDPGETGPMPINSGHQLNLVRRLLAEIEQANLFLIPLDNERHWYRYHHLFRDLLRARHNQSNPGRAAQLLTRASAWFENDAPILWQKSTNENWIVQAIHYALGAEDYTRAIRLVEQHTIDLLSRGELHNLLRWIDLLPTDQSTQRPWLCICRAWAYYFSGNMQAVEKALNQARAHMASNIDDTHLQELEANIAAIQCAKAVILNDAESVLQNAKQAQSILAPNSWVYSLTKWGIAYISRGQGDLDRASQLFAQVIAEDRARNNAWGVAMNAADLGMVYRVQGLLHTSLQTFNSAIEYIESRHARHNGYVGRLLTALAISLYELNDLDQAQALLQEAVELNQFWFNPNHCVFAYTNLARVLTARGDFHAATSALDSAETAVHGLPIVATLEQAIIAGRIRLLLALGKTPSISEPYENEIQDLLRDVEHPPSTFHESREIRQGIATRVLIVQGRLREALTILTHMEDIAIKGQRSATLIEVLGLKAIVLFEAGQKSRANDTMTRALQTAFPEGYRRAFLDLAPLRLSTLRQLLENQISAANPFTLSPATELLSALSGLTAKEITQNADNRPPSVKNAQNLVEPLTKRELEILALIAEGLTNAQIGQRLVVSFGTVKAHTASIYRKLDAGNRTQAVAIARSYGIIKPDKPPA